MPSGCSWCGRIGRAMDFHPGGHDVEDGDSRHGNDPNGIVGYFAVLVRSGADIFVLEDRLRFGGRSYISVSGPACTS